MSLDAQCVEVYGLNYMQPGLVYLPSGVAGGVGSYGAGRSSSSPESRRYCCKLELTHLAGKPVD